MCTEGAEGVPTSSGHKCQTVQEVGWAGKQNGELLSLTEAAFDTFINLDTNLSFQQNLAGPENCNCGASVFFNRLDKLRHLFPACAKAPKAIKPGELILIESPD